MADVQPLEDLLARLEREREAADRAYNDALTALDRALPATPDFPDLPASFDPALQSRPLVETAAPAPAPRAPRLRSLLWRLLGSAPDRDRAIHRALSDDLARTTAALDALQRTVGTVIDVARRQFDARVRFESLLVQYLQTITLYVDTKDRSLGGTELRQRLSLAEQRLLLLKRELEPRSAQAAGPPAPASSGVFSGRVDSSTYVGFEDRFRGARADIARRVEDYLPILTGSSDILDVGCGRGELLDLLAAKGIRARGIDVNAAMVELCRERGLHVEQADALTFLEHQPDAALGGLVAIQVVEHFDPAYLARFLETAFHKMRAGAPLILETINPACWMAFFETYIRDLTHQRPLHPDTLRFLVEASGFSNVDVQFRQPVTEGDRLDRVAAIATEVPEAVRPALAGIAAALNAHADKLNARLFSSMDYAVIARR